jgi:DNA adenine methylase
MYSNKLYTPLRYPGGKARFAPFIASVIQDNGLDGGHYMEPYAGGAGVALELLFDGTVTDIHINDADPAVFAFWHAATAHATELIRLVETAPLNMEAWGHWQKVMRGETLASEVERGFATLFMNRTNRSGILKGGVIGGKAQAGTYLLDARFKRDVLVGRLARIAEHARHIHVYCEDAIAILRRIREILPPRSLIYLDPPYYVKGQGLYRNFYRHEDHLEIARLLQQQTFSRHWVVSYDNTEPIREMYSGVRSIDYGLGYTAQRRYVGSELMCFDNRLTLPVYLELRKAA